MSERASVRQARQALSDLFTDKSVSPERIAEDLETLRDTLDIMLDALESDREREAKAGKAEFDPWSYRDI